MTALACLRERSRLPAKVTDWTARFSEQACMCPPATKVATLPIAQLSPILIDCMWEFPSELIPNNEQIADLCAILVARSDAEAPNLQQIVAECDEYLKI